jgi:uncharacterized membrane protein YraQ (UPF0718 family)
MELMMNEFLKWFLTVWFSCGGIAAVLMLRIAFSEGIQGFVENKTLGQAIGSLLYSLLLTVLFGPFSLVQAAGMYFLLKLFK